MIYKNGKIIVPELQGKNITHAYYNEHYISILEKKPETWQEIQKAVRNGTIRRYFNIGDQLTCSHSEFGTLVWDIIGFDHDVPADTNYTHSMTLGLHDVLNQAMKLSESQATWYIDENTYPQGLSAGTYFFTLPENYAVADGGGKTYNFTLTNAVPVGGQIHFDWLQNKNAADCKILTYTSPEEKEYIEEVGVTEGEGGTAMPALSTTSVTNNTNAIQRTRFGNSNWSQSVLRQWLNANSDSNAWWEAKTVFDRSPDISSNGFLNGIDSDFLNVIGNVTKKTQLSISDGYGLDISEERFFLLSRTEVYAGIERSADGQEGDIYEYYGNGRSDLTAPGTEADTNRIKTKDGSAVIWKLRTPYYSTGSNTRQISQTGALGQNAANRDFYISMACCIY